MPSKTLLHSTLRLLEGASNWFSRCKGWSAPSKPEAKGARAAPPYTTSGPSVELLQMSTAEVSAEDDTVDCVVTSPVGAAATSPESSKVQKCLHRQPGWTRFVSSVQGGQGPPARVPSLDVTGLTVVVNKQDAAGLNCSPPASTGTRNTDLTLEILDSLIALAQPS